MLPVWNQSGRLYSSICLGWPRYGVAVSEDSVLRPTAIEHEGINILNASRGKISGSSIWGLQRTPRMKRCGYWIRLEVEKPQFSAQISYQCDWRHYQLLLDRWDMRIVEEREAGRNTLPFGLFKPTLAKLFWFPYQSLSWPDLKIIGNSQSTNLTSRKQLYFLENCIGSFELEKASILRFHIVRAILWLG